MKAAAILAAAILLLVYALASGAWAFNDYHNHEEVKRYFLRQAISHLSFRDDAGKPMDLDVRKMASYFERNDERVGAISLACLVGSIALFWWRTHAFVKPVDSN